MALKDKLRNIRCENGHSMPQYLMKSSVGVTVEDEDMVSLALLDLPKS